MAVVLDEIDVEERVGIPIDFTDEIGSDTLDLVTVSVRVIDGEDSNPAAVVDGLPSVVGAMVIVPLRGMVNFCDYHIRVKVTTVGGSVIVVPLILRVRRF